MSPGGDWGRAVRDSCSVALALNGRKSAVRHATTGRRPLPKADVTPFVAKAVSTHKSCDQPVHPAMLANGSQLSGMFLLTDVDVSVTAPPITL